MCNFGKLTKKQLAVLEQIAVNNDAGHSERTLESLVGRGLIERHWEKHGILSIKRYYMPIQVHMAWCAWVSTDEGAE